MTNSLTLIAGLGNPDAQYRDTLHNAGFWFVDAVARKYGGTFKNDRKMGAETCRVDIDGHEVWLAKPQQYMNLSGGPLRAMLDYYRLEARDMLVAHDEIDLPPGTVRLKKGGGHGGHNGLRDVISHCGAEFLRLRLGVGHPGDKNQVTGYVLKRASREVESAVLENIDEAIEVLPLLLDKGADAAMKSLHTKQDS